MGSKGSTTETKESTPWAGQQPYLKDLFSQGQNLFNQGPQQYYPGQTVAPFSPQSQQGMDATMGIAQGGSPQLDQMGQYLSNTFGQQNINPYEVFNPANQAAQGIGPGQNMMQQAGAAGMGLSQPNQMVGGASDALQGMTGYGGLASAQQFAGQPGMGALPASQDYVNQTLADSPQFGDIADDIAGRTPGVDAERLNQQFGPGGAAQQQLAQTSQGDFLGSNPYLDQMFDTASGRAGEAFQEQVQPGINATFGAGGRTGGGIHQQMMQNANRQFGRDLQGMAADIYAPAYESERGRQMNAASALGGLDMQGQGLGLSQGQSNQSTGLAAGGQNQGAALQGMGLAGNIYGDEQSRRLGAAGLGGDLYSQQNQAELGRGQLASSQYLGERGLGQQGAGMLGDLGLGQGNLALGGAQLGGQMGQGLGNLGMQGVNSMADMYGNINQNQYRAGTLAPGFRDSQYGDASRMMGVGGMVEDQAQRMMGANQDRWNFNQQAPWQNMNNYANTIYGLPGGYGTQSQTTPGGSRLAGAAGGAMTGAALGPWGALGGGILGAFS